MKHHSLAVTALLSTTLGIFAFSCNDAAHDVSSNLQAGAGGEVASGASSGSGGSQADGGRNNPVTAIGGALGGMGGAVEAQAGQAGAGGVPSQAGAAGQGGLAGAGGQENEGFGRCQVGCATHADCVIENAEPRFCDANSLRCAECTEDAHCVAMASALSRAVCVQDDDCLAAFNEVCIDVAGLGRCAAPPDPQGGCFFGEPTNMTRFGSAPPVAVEVCLSQAGRCVAQRCIVSCDKVEGFCTTESIGHGQVCDALSGRCTCSSDDECSWGPEHCNSLTRECDECATAADCEGAPNGPNCVEGRCACVTGNQCPMTSSSEGAALCE